MMGYRASPSGSEPPTRSEQTTGTRFRSRQRQFRKSRIAIASRTRESRSLFVRSERRWRLRASLGGGATLQLDPYP